MEQRLGSYEWARQTGGALTAKERRRLIAAIARSYHRLLLDRTKLATGRVPKRAREIEPASILPPDSAFAREAEEACAEQPEVVIGHSYRTWVFGTALSRFDGAEPDRELFYVAALLHDAGIAEPTADRDFTIASADIALDVAKRSGVEGERSTAIADGICGHITPGAKADEDPIAYYVQGGAVTDLLGLRRCEISKRVRQMADSEHPRGDVRRELARMWRAESKAVPKGRAALLSRWARFPLAARFGPSGGLKATASLSEALALYSL